VIDLPEDYVVLKFYELGYRPIYNKFNGTYQCACPLCREGKSLNKKRRCYYIPKNNNIFCHNCGHSSKPFKWIKEVSGVDDSVIINELKDYTPDVDTILDESPKAVVNTETLPTDSINLSDASQLEYYKNDDTVRATINLIKLRRLDTAVNRPDNLYLSLTDRVHKNRLIIPFVNENNQIEHYQTRTVLGRDNRTKPKFLSKSGGAQKPLFNVNKVSSDHDSIYIFEGPMDAFFVRNSVAVAGITEKGRSLTDRQQQQLDGPLRFYDAVWILDSQWVDRASLIKSEVLLQQGERVFIWPEKFGKRFKDFNDIAVTCKIDEIKHEFIQKNTFKGLEGIVKLTEVKQFANLG
jgi:hypothetical protein